MPANGSSQPSDAGRQGRVTSMARWLSRRRGAPAPAPKVSVVIPVFNAESTLRECLAKLHESRYRDFETILVDDGCTDQSPAIAAEFPVRIVPTSGRVGPAAARNLGARMATGEVLFFIDSDVMVRPDTLSLLADSFEAGEVDGLCGVQAAQMRYTNIASQYKNLWMRWTYLRQTGDVPLFYTTAAAIRREAFLRVGGFDQGYATACPARLMPGPLRVTTAHDDVGPDLELLDADLRRIFSAEPRQKSRATAVSFLRSIKREIEQLVGDGTGVHKYAIDHVYELMIERAGQLKLRVSGSREQAKRETMIMLTVQTMNVIHSGYHRISL